MRSDARPMATPELKARAIGQPRQAQESKAGFYLVLAYLLFEFGRPQELIPGLRVIPFGTGLSVLILLKVLMSGKLDFSRLQTKLWIPSVCGHGDSCADCREQLLGSHDVQGYVSLVLCSILAS